MIATEQLECGYKAKRKTSMPLSDVVGLAGSSEQVSYDSDFSCIRHLLQRTTSFFSIHQSVAVLP